MLHSLPGEAKRLVFSGKQTVALEPFALERPGAASVLVRIQLTLMSTGTENIVFNRMFDPGTHWDHWVKYPFYPGYTAVGTVEAVGEEVTTLQPGDRVACRVPHCSHAVVEAAKCFPLPASLGWESAVWFSLAKIAWHGASVARYQLGDSVLIAGAGPIGQMSIRWAVAAGCASVVVVDPVPDRMKLARLGGATATVAESMESARAAVLEAGHEQLPRVIIDSTGNAAVFAASLSLVADYGTVVILGDTGQPARQSLTSDVIRRGLTIVGAHDRHNTAEWNNATITRLFFQLAAAGRFSLDGLNTHCFLPEECGDAYHVANHEREKTMGILFKWST